MLSLWGVKALLSLSRETLPRLSEVRIDLSVLGFTVAIALLTSLLTLGRAEGLERESLEALHRIKPAEPEVMSSKPADQK